MNWYVAIDRQVKSWIWTYTTDPGPVKDCAVWHVEADTEEEAKAKALRADRGEREANRYPRST